jgi:hypothetical protein
MKAKILSAIIILAGFIIVITSQIIVALDAPHNASNNISCGSCQGKAVTCLTYLCSKIRSFI